MLGSSSAIYSAEPARGWLPWGALAPFIGIALVVAPLAAVSLVLVHFHLVDTQDDPIGPIGLYAFLLLPFAAMGCVIVAWVRFVERRPLATIGLTGFRPARIFLRGHLFGAGMVCAIVAGIWIAGGFAAEGGGVALHSVRALANITLLAACFAVQSSVEEIVFRGWLLSVIARKFPLWVAVLVSSILFTLLHFDGPDQPWLFTLNVLLFAIFACSWSLRSGNIWGVMGWHAGWNWLFGTGFELRVTGLDLHVPALLVKLVPHGPDDLTGGALGPEGSVVCTLLLLGGIVFLARPRTG